MYRLKRRFCIFLVSKNLSQNGSIKSATNRNYHINAQYLHTYIISYTDSESKRNNIFTLRQTHMRVQILWCLQSKRNKYIVILLMQDDTQHTHSSPSCFSKILSVTHGMPPSLHWMRFDFKYVPSFYQTQVDHFIPLSKTETVLSPVFSLDLNIGYSW